MSRSQKKTYDVRVIRGRLPESPLRQIADSHGVAVYEASRVDYPQRMRAWPHEAG